MKTLASCKPTEFIKQTNLIWKSVDKWLTDTDIMNIRRRMPRLEAIPVDASLEERKEIDERNKKAMKEQVNANLYAIFDAILDEHADETLEVLALCCFVDPAEVDNHTVAEYLGAVAELLNDESVVNFFISLARWGKKNT